MSCFSRRLDYPQGGYKHMGKSSKTFTVFLLESSSFSFSFQRIETWGNRAGPVQQMIRYCGCLCCVFTMKLFCSSALTISHLCYWLVIRTSSTQCALSSMWLHSIVLCSLLCRVPLVCGGLHEQMVAVLSCNHILYWSQSELFQNVICGEIEQSFSKIFIKMACMFFLGVFAW